MPPKNLSCKKAHQIIFVENNAEKLLVIDVRSPHSYDKGHIKDAINIDVEGDDYLEQFEKLDRQRQYLVYCRCGNDSDIALRIMKRLGFTNIFHLYQGLDTWKEKNLPICES